MQVSTQARYLDYSAKSIYAKNARRALPDDDGALIRKVGERTEEERRRHARQRAAADAGRESLAGDVSNVVPAPFMMTARRDMARDGGGTVRPTTSNAMGLWSLIDAVEADGVPGAPIEPVVITPPASQAESLYLLLAQVISDDE